MNGSEIDEAGTAGAAEGPGAVRARVPFRRLYGLARPYMGPLVGATVLLVLMSAVGLVVPKLAGDVVDTALMEASGADLRRIVLGLIGLFAVLGVVGYVEYVLLGSAGVKLLRDLRRRLFDHFVGLSPGFYDERRVGELLSRLGADLAVVQQAITEQIPTGLQAALRFVGTLVVLLVLQPRLTLLALVVVPPVVIVAMAVGARLERLSRKERDEMAEAIAEAEETLFGIRTIQAAAAEDRRRAAFAERIGVLLGVQLQNVRLHGAFAALMTFAGFTAFALVLGYGGHLMQQGRLQPGELTSFLLYTFSIAMSVGQLGGLYAGYRKLQGSSARLFELLDTASEVPDPALADPPAAPLALEGGAVRLEGVRFRYPGAPAAALDGVTLDVPAGGMVALVGPSGSGKSTLFSLVLRFYDPAGGRVTLDGRDVRTVGLADLRRAVGLVPQDVVLFSGTIADNLRLAAPDADEAALWSALEAAAARAFVEALPEGLHTPVGERGVKLSGGERQRLAIARAFLADPRILLLDEPTSALDSDSEALVQEALQRLFPGRTTLVIAHRLATARRADRIFVLDGGRITAGGTHDELMATSELYRRYWEQQSALGPRAAGA